MAQLAAVLDRLNGRAKRLYNEEARRAARKERYIRDRDRRKARFDKADAASSARVERLKALLHTEITLRASMLFSGDLKSFATRHFIFSARKDLAKRKITDPDAFVQLAREAHVMGAICDRKVTVTYTPNLKKFDEWAATHPELAEQFLDLISEPGPDRLGVKPNQEHLTEFDPDRLSGTYISLEPKS